MAFVIGALSASLIIAVVGLLAQRLVHRRSLSAALAHETFALDRARAAELRSAQQIDAMLDRISTEPRLELRPASTAVVEPSTRKYIADHPADDEAWNDYRGGGEEDEPE